MLVWAGVTFVLRCRAAAAGLGAFGETMRHLLMELAIFGFALNASYGFGQKPLSGIVGSGTPRGRAIEATFWLHNSVVALLAFSHSDWTAFIGPFGVAVLAAAAFSYALGMRGFVRVRRTSSRPEVGQTVLRR